MRPLGAHFWSGWTDFRYKRMPWHPFSSPRLFPCQFLRFGGFHFLFIAFLKAWQKVSVIPPDFIPFCLTNVDSPPSSHTSHMELLKPLFYNKKKCPFILLQNLLFQHHQHRLDIRVQCLTEPKKLHPTVPLECKGLHSPPPHSVLAPRALQSPRSEGRERWLQPPCALLQSMPAFLHCIQNLQLMPLLALSWCNCVDIT